MSVRGLIFNIVNNAHYLVSSSADESIKIWNVLNGQNIHIMRGHNNIVESLTLNL